MSFIGNQNIYNEIIATAIRGDLAHAVLLIGPDGIGKRTLAKEIVAQLLGCVTLKLETKPDFHYFAPDDDGLTVEKMRGVREQITSYAFAGGAKVVMIDGVDTLAGSAANVLLKVLEEPTAKTFFFLCAESYHAVLPTIRSRCVTHHLNPVSEEFLQQAFQSYAQEPFFDACIEYAVGRPGIAQRLLTDSDYRSEIMRYMREFIELTDSSSSNRLLWAEKMTPKGDATEMKSKLLSRLLWFEVAAYGILKKENSNEWMHWIDALHETRHVLRANVSVRSVIDLLFIKLPS